MQEQEHKWQVIGRGKAGWHAKSLACSSSGGELEQRRYASGAVSPGPGYAAEALDGALVYDAEQADEAAFRDFVISGPMLDLHLPPGGVRRFGAEGRETARRMLPGLAGAYRTLAAVAQSESYTGLDQAGLGIWERLLRAIPGVRFGRVRSGQVEWETE